LDPVAGWEVVKEVGVVEAEAARAGAVMGEAELVGATVAGLGPRVEAVGVVACE